MDKGKNFFKLNYPFDVEDFKEKLGRYYEAQFKVIGFKVNYGHIIVTLQFLDPFEFDYFCNSNEYMRKMTFNRAKDIYEGKEFEIEIHVSGRPGGVDFYELLAGDTVYISEEGVFELICCDEITLESVRSSDFSFFNEFPSKEHVVVTKPDGYVGIFRIKITEYYSEYLNEILGEVESELKLK